MMIVKQTMQISAGIFPCLFYHDKSDYNEEERYVVPNHLAMQLNYRNVDPTRIGVKCEDKSLLTEACQSNDEFPSFLTVHSLKIVFTSFVNQVASDNCIRMTSALSPHPSTKIFAKALNETTIVGAIKWLRGDDDEFHVTSPNEGMSAYLKAYFKSLQDLISLFPANDGDDDDENPFKKVGQFIQVREWPDDKGKNDVLEIIDAYAYNCKKFWVTCCAVRRFFYENLAKQTKIVGHTIDGLHRITALEVALTEPNAMRNCTLFAATDVYLTNNLNLEFIEKMRGLSNQTQTYQGRLKEHGRREIFRHLIQEMERRWTTQKTGGQESYHVNPDHLLPQAECIVEVLSDPNFHFKGYEELQLKKGLTEKERHNIISKLFQTQTKTEADDPMKGKWTLQLELYKNTPLPALQRYANGIYNSKRYNLGDEVGSNLFELAQVLMWTRISKDSYKLLFNFFGKDYKNQLGQTSPADKAMTDRWVTCMVHTIAASVYYTNMLCKARFDPKPALPVIIERALLPTLDFFSTHGINPELPEWFSSITSTYDQDNDKGLLPTDFYTFITVIFATHLHVGVCQSKPGKKTVRDDLHVHGSDLDALFQNLHSSGNNVKTFWSPNIQLYVEKVLQGGVDMRPAIDEIIKKMRDYYIKPITMSSSKNNDDGPMIEKIEKPSEAQYDTLKKLIKAFQSREFLDQMDRLDPSTSEDLRRRIVEFDVALLSKHYRDGVDKEGGNMEGGDMEGVDLDEDD
jgi:hypothetical protein